MKMDKVPQSPNEWTFLKNKNTGRETGKSKGKKMIGHHSDPGLPKLLATPAAIRV
jgi:hypothetical protein